ncbi:NAD(P)H-binding protein [Nonomuraea thailandensis]|uniref:NAD(P)H-binding protein n=1 Tax=Nonomuraea thailandensis TaxID=1188745 RepID=UPI003383B456
MKLTVFGPADRIGQHVLAQAIAAGHDVTAVARDPAKLSPGVRAITSDLSAPDPAVLEPAVRGGSASPPSPPRAAPGRPGARPAPGSSCGISAFPCSGTCSASISPTSR